MTHIKYEIKLTHIDLINSGDVIEINGELFTVSKNNIKNTPNGRTIRGDSYNLGQKPVRKAVIFKAMPV